MRRLAIPLLAALCVTAVAAARPHTYAVSRTLPPLDDAAILAIFDLANTADIETGLLGARRGHSQDVRDFGKMLAQVHTDVRQKGRDLGKKLGITPALPADNTMAKEHAAALARLSKLSGAEFDAAFLEHEQAFHKAVLDAVKGTLLPAIQNRELKEFVASLGPAFESHRVAAEQLHRKLAN
jgi:putative membrane protein